MTPHEVAALLAHMTRLDPRNAPDPAEADARLDQWCELLADVPPTAPGGWDVARTVRDHITTSPYPILPVDITRRWATHRRDQLGRHTDQRPTADPDNWRAYRDQLAEQRRAVATGQAPPSTHYELTSGGPAPQVAERLVTIGSYVPAHVRQQLAPYRPLRSEREATVAAGRPDPLSVLCQWCGAPVGEPCRSRVIDPRGAATANRRRPPHPSRIDAAHGNVA